MGSNRRWQVVVALASACCFADPPASADWSQGVPVSDGLVWAQPFEVKRLGTAEVFVMVGRLEAMPSAPLFFEIRDMSLKRRYWDSRFQRVNPPTHLEWNRICSVRLDEGHYVLIFRSRADANAPWLLASADATGDSPRAQPFDIAHRVVFEGGQRIEVGPPEDKHRPISPSIRLLADVGRDPTVVQGVGPLVVPQEVHLADEQVGEDPRRGLPLARSPTTDAERSLAGALALLLLGASLLRPPGLSRKRWLIQGAAVGSAAVLALGIGVVIFFVSVSAVGLTGVLISFLATLFLAPFGVGLAAAQFHRRSSWGRRVAAMAVLTTYSAAIFFYSAFTTADRLFAGDPAVRGILAVACAALTGGWLALSILGRSPPDGAASGVQRAARPP